ncbi:O-methyltransferase [Starkeya koreensis]|uniref:O-methyltransferase n=1 Tax=Ancylobacter koreensis TaxID=266121 RepID=A0ABT0DPL7_9HYPH|nr:O-methyltransferase [Ancylobacter koreensis]MCK0209228.1 O-methyltransferase [Ancylobacter koreensis]
MTQQLWTAVDDYIADALVAPDAALEDALAASAAAGLPDIAVAPNQGKLLMILAKLAGARRILEIGTLGGYSTIWLARALPADGRLVTLEVVPAHAAVARANIEAAGLGERVEVRLGPALESLRALEREGEAPFDLVFIDADKPNNVHYLDWALRFARIGTLIVADNVVREGKVLDAGHDDPRVKGVRATYDWFARQPRVCATAVQTVGAKGHDGFAVGLVTD